MQAALAQQVHLPELPVVRREDGDQRQAPGAADGGFELVELAKAAGQLGVRRRREPRLAHHQQSLGLDRQLGAQPDQGHHVDDIGRREARLELRQVLADAGAAQLAGEDRSQKVLIAVEARPQPGVGRLLTDPEDDHEDQRHAQNQRRGRQARREDKVVEERVQRGGQQPTRQKQMRAERIEALRQIEKRDRQDRGHRAVHDRRAKAADDPHPELGLRQDAKILDVLDGRETGADGKPPDRRIHQKADAPPPERQGDNRPLEQLLHHRRDIARVGREVELEQRRQPVVELQAGPGGGGAPRQRHRHRRDADQLVAVEQHQPEEKRQHRQQADTQAQGPETAARDLHQPGLRAPRARRSWRRASKRRDLTVLPGISKTSLMSS